jgi:hypothetical protein
MPSNDACTIRVRADKGRVYLLVQGRPALEMPWEAAAQLAKALRTKAMEARENVQHDIVIADQAMLMGLGSPLALSGNRKLLHEARKSAEDLLRPGFLRRNKPAGGITSPAAVGTPAIANHSLQRKETGNA